VSGAFTRRIHVTGGSFLAAATAFGVTWLLLLSAVSLGLRLPLLRHLSPFADPSPTYVGHHGAAFPSLSDAYVNQLLGVGRPAYPGSPRIEDLSSPVSLTQVPRRPVGGVPGGPETVDFPFTNDDFADAYPIRGLPFSGSTDMTGASREPGEPTGCAPTGGTAWFRYSVKGGPRGLRVDSGGGGAPISLGVFSGHTLSALTKVGCTTSAKGDAVVSFSPVDGTTYYLQVTTPVDGPLVLHAVPLDTASVASTYSSGQVNGSGGSLSTVSADGRYVAFQSASPDLDPRHVAPAGGEYVYVRDRLEGRTELVSLSSSGRPAQGASSMNSISGDGRYVAFQTTDDSLVPDDGNGLADVYIHDRDTGSTVLASRTPSGRVPAPNQPLIGWTGSVHPHLSTNGRVLGFDSDAPEFDPRRVCGPENCYRAIVRDLVSGRVDAVAMNGAREVSGESYLGAVSGDGRFAVFASASLDLPGANGLWQVYLRDRVRQTTVLVSQSTGGSTAMADTGGPPSPQEFGEFTDVTASVSDDGRFVSYQSGAANLLPGDTNGLTDTFVRDTHAGTTTRVSLSSRGAQGTGSRVSDARQTLRLTSLSASGRYVAFDSVADGLDPADHNGGSDIFVHDLRTGVTLRASDVLLDGQPVADGFYPVLTADGRTVCFVTSTTNGRKGVYLRRLVWPPG
jgi:hypothetical protein